MIDEIVIDGYTSFVDRTELIFTLLDNTKGASIEFFSKFSTSQLCSYYVRLLSILKE